MSIYLEFNKNIVGKQLTRNILTFKDEVIAKKGQMITVDLLKAAEEKGVLDDVLNSTSKKRLHSYY